jgi:tetratricopeptide (TPR) repeat protein
VDAFHEALKEHTRERAPLEWAAAQYNLGLALTSLGQRGGDTGFLEDGQLVVSAGTPDEGTGEKRLEQAVAAYREALKEYTRERAPLDWGATQSNLGNALLSRGEYEQALAALREALKERTRERVPLKWATTQIYLGKALLKLAEATADKPKRCAALKTAREHFAGAREEYSKVGASNAVGTADANIAGLEADIARLCR